MNIDEIMKAVSNWPSERIDDLIGQLEPLADARAEDERHLLGITK